ncbi:hypothetical protein Bhyg_13182, partial [Pseudolycoriella hygida]
IELLCFSLLFASIVAAANDEENPNVEDSFVTHEKKQSKRGTEKNRQDVNANLNSVTNHPSVSFTNLPQFSGGHFAQLGNFFASAATPQVAIAAPALYQPYQLAYTHQPLSYSPAAIAVPYNNQQHIMPISQTNGYQLAAIPHQQVQVSQPYSYVTSAPNEAGKVVANAGHANNAQQHQQQTFTYSTYQHVAAPINLPTTQKFVAFPSYSPAQYQAVNGPSQPSTTASTYTPTDGATSFATFSQQLNQRHHATPTALTPVKVLAQPQQYYVTVPPPPSSSSAGYSSQKITFQPIPAAPSPQAYESPHNANVVVHYGTHLYHPTLAKYANMQIAPSQKIIYSH